MSGYCSFQVEKTYPEGSTTTHFFRTLSQAKKCALGMAEVGCDIRIYETSMYAPFKRTEIKPERYKRLVKDILDQLD